MQSEVKQRWQELCEQAASEQDPEQLIRLIREINELLEAKEKRLQERRAERTSAA